MGRDGTRMNPLPKVGELFCGAFRFEGVDDIKINNSNRKEYYFKLRCFCGNFIVKKEITLRKQHSKYKNGDRSKSTCGDSIKHHDLQVKDKIGRLTIEKIYFSNKNKNGTISDGNRKNADCICECGKNFTCRLTKLVHAKKINSRISCGCWKSEYLKNVKSTHGLSRPSDGVQRNKIFTMYHAAKSRATKSEIPFNIDFEDIKKVEYCPVLGFKLDWKSTELRENSPSLDKFYPDLGYVKGNIQVISHKANTLKNNGSPEDWIRIAAWCKKEEIKLKLEGMHPDQKKE